MELVQRFSNVISLKDVDRGDHIYTYRCAYAYAHHGIYIGEEMVIHFGNDGRETGTGTSFGSLLSSNSSVGSSERPCKKCEKKMMIHEGVVKSCIECFLSGGSLYRFEYSATFETYRMKMRGFCTMVPSDPTEKVIERATYLLQKGGFGSYNLFRKNCEDFAIYCKTSYVLDSKGVLGQSTQVQSVKAALSFAGTLLNEGVTPLSLMECFQNFCDDRCKNDINSRGKKVEPEDLLSSLN